MFINYYPILIFQTIISILLILVSKKNLKYSGYLKLIVANLALCVVGLYVVPLRLTRIRFFTVPPNLIPFQGIDLNVIEISYLIVPFMLITILFSLLFSYQKSYKSIFLGSGLSVFIQFVAFAIQSQRAEITFIIIQVMGVIAGYLLYLLIYNSIKSITNIAESHDL